MPVIPSLSPELRAEAALLERGLESIRAVTANEPNRFTRAFEALNRLAISDEISLAIVDGLGAIHFGYLAITEDIDVVVAKDDLDHLLADAPQHGFKVKWRSRTGWHTLTFEDVEINVVPEGGKARDSSPTTIPGPSALGVDAGLGYASLAGWMDRAQDQFGAGQRPHSCDRDLEDSQRR